MAVSTEAELHHTMHCIHITADEALAINGDLPSLYLLGQVQFRWNAPALALLKHKQFLYTQTTIPELLKESLSEQGERLCW